MDKNRREFLKMTAITTAGIAGSPVIFNAFGTNDKTTILNTNQQQQLSIIGQYGPWAVSENSKSLPSHSFRNPKWKNHQEWQAAAKKSNA